MKTILLFICGLLTQCLYGQTKLEPSGVGITVKNAEQACRWYEHNLKFKTYKKIEFPEYDSLKICILRQGKFEIELVEKRTSFSIKGLRPDYNLIKEPLEGFSKIVFRSKNLKQLYEELKQNGVKEVMGITHSNKDPNLDFFIIEDMDGNWIQFLGR